MRRWLVRHSYRPDIDGLRAIAVLAVLIYHYRVLRLPGGFVGVDVFFVISGYLITGNLFQGITTSGLSIKDFYNRRIRRIFPAMLVMLAVTLAAGWFLLLPGDYASLGDSTAYSAFGAGNFYFYWHTGYFDREADLLPLLHMWSLGVEEQFYLVWPTLLALLYWLARGRRNVLAAFVSLIILISLASCLYLANTDPKGAFYLPYARAWELAAGALLVFLPQVRSRAWSEAIGILGLALVLYSIFALSPDGFPDWTAILPVLGAALLIAPRAESVVARVLSTPPMRFTGLISYSLYLWHWPLLVFYRQYMDGKMPSARMAVVIAVVAYAVSALSWKFVERPFRKRPAAQPFRVIATGLAAASAVLLAGLVTAWQGGFVSRLPPNVAELRSLDVMWKWDCPRTLSLTGLPENCNFGVPWDEAKVRAFLWGDSHAEHMAPLVEAATRGKPASFLLYRGCPAALGDHVRRVRKDIPTYVATCTDSRSRAIGYLDEHPEVNLVVLAAAWSHLARVVSQDGTIAGHPGPQALVAHGLRTLIEATARPGRQFIIIADVPQLRRDPIPCVISQSKGVLRQGCKSTDVTVSAATFRKSQSETYRQFTAIADERPDTQVVLPGNALCTGKWCQAYLDGEYLYRDSSHLRRNLSVATRQDYARLIGLTATLDSAVAHSAVGPVRAPATDHASAR